MQLAIRFLLSSLCLSFSLVAAAPAAEYAYVVTYIEAMPAAAGKAAGMIRQLAKASRKDAGSVRFETLQRIGHPGQFAIVEVWDNEKDQETHAAAGHTKDFRDKLKPLLRAPYDERPHTGLSIGEAAAGKPAVAKGAIYAVTHVDIVPKFKDDGVAAVKQLSEASRSDKGNLRFDALTQSSRPNHMTLVEIWTDQKALDAHGNAEHTMQLREKLLPMSGSLFDQRLYRSLD